MNSLPLAVIILTRNEEQNLPVALGSLQGLGARVFVVDSGSTDRTVAIAIERGCAVASHPWTTYAEQFDWAVRNCPIDTEWYMRMDADERLTPELCEELRSELVLPQDGVSALQMRRRVYFWGTWIRHGGFYPTWLVRVWRRGSAHIEARWMDEHMVVHHGSVRSLRYDIIDENQKGLSFWVDKHNRYADREVTDLLAVASRRGAADLEGQAGRRRWIKQNLYSRSPLFVRAFAYWFLRYVLLLGFLDGKAGLVFHFLQGFWYRFLVDAKLVERRGFESGAGSKRAGIGERQ